MATTSSPISTRSVQGLTSSGRSRKCVAVNTKIRLKIVRKGQGQSVDVTLVRDNIRVRSGARARGRR